MPCDVHVVASGDEAYSIADPVYQNAQWRLEVESKKLFRAPEVVEDVEVDAPTTETCACAEYERAIAAIATNVTRHKLRQREQRRGTGDDGTAFIFP